MFQASRSESPVANEDRAKAEAEKLYNAGEDSAKALFKEILCSGSYFQLRLTFRHYYQVAALASNQILLACYKVIRFEGFQAISIIVVTILQHIAEVES